MNVAVIGVGGRGGSNLAEWGKQRTLWRCRRGRNGAGRGPEKIPQAQRFNDFRKLYEIEKQFDAV